MRIAIASLVALCAPHVVLRELETLNNDSLGSGEW